MYCIVTFSASQYHNKKGLPTPTVNNPYAAGMDKAEP